MTQQTMKLSGALFLLCALSVQAEPLDIKPGLWETTSTTGISGMQMPAEALVNLPPEQRASVEAAMKARLGDMQKSITVNTCITKEDLDKPFDDGNEANKTCTNTVVSATATHAQYNIDCSGDEARKGVMTVDALSRESVKYSLVMHINNGTVTNEATSKWIGADCPKEQ